MEKAMYGYDFWAFYNIAAKLTQSRSNCCIYILVCKDIDLKESKLNFVYFNAELLITLQVNINYTLGKKI